MTILLNLKRFGQLYIIIILFSTLMLYYAAYTNAESENATLDAYIEVQNHAINQLNKANENYKKEQIEADKRAEQIRKEGKRNIDKINKVIIPDDCQQAIKEGIRLKEDYGL